MHPAPRPASPLPGSVTLRVSSEAARDKPHRAARRPGPLRKSQLCLQARARAAGPGGGSQMRRGEGERNTAPRWGSRWAGQPEGRPWELWSRTAQDHKRKASLCSGLQFPAGSPHLLSSRPGLWGRRAQGHNGTQAAVLGQSSTCSFRNFTEHLSRRGRARPASR